MLWDGCVYARDAIVAPSKMNDDDLIDSLLTHSRKGLPSTSKTKQDKSRMCLTRTAYGRAHRSRSLLLSCWPRPAERSSWSVGEARCAVTPMPQAQD